MVDSQSLFNDIDKHILEDERPSEYLNSLLHENKLREYPFNMLFDLTKAEQNKKYHPEGSVWNHTMMVLDEAANRKDKSESPRVFMWAALLHDIGKPSTTRVRKGKITSYNHEKVGKDMAVEFLKEFMDDEAFIKKVAALVRWHMEPLFLAKNSPSANTEQMLREVSLDELALLSICDRFGRGNMSDKKRRDEEKGIEMFVEKCRKIQKSMKK